MTDAVFDPTKGKKKGGKKLLKKDASQGDQAEIQKSLPSLPSFF